MTYRAGASFGKLLFFTLNREDFSFVIHLDRQPRTSRRREAQTGSRARSGSRSERTLDAVEHSRTLMEWWPFLIFHRGGLRIKVINNSSWHPELASSHRRRHATGFGSVAIPTAVCLLFIHPRAPNLINLRSAVLPPLSVGEMTLRLYGALNYSQNSARDLRCALNRA